MVRRFLACAVAATLVAVAVQAVSARADGDPRPPATLQDTGLYLPGQPGVVDPANRPFSPQYPLWTDGAAKSRWIHLPAGAVIDATNVDDWDYPVGTRFWKEFRFSGRKVETRLLWKAAPGRWVAASYVWNDAQTEATLAPGDGVPFAVEVSPGKWHEVPAAADCQACHGAGRMRPIGFNALQLSTDRDPAAIHGGPAAEGSLTLATLVGERLLSPARMDLVESPPRIRASEPLTRTVLGYLSTNCGTCHNGGHDITADIPSLRAADVMRDGDAAARALLAHRTRWQVPGQPEGAGLLIHPGDPASSTLLARMRSRRPSSQMPPMGTVLQDGEALAAVERWIAALPRLLDARTGGT